MKRIFTLFCLITLSCSFAFTQTSEKIEQYGITWYFDTFHTYGQFANGDYWVLGPVTITRITPDFDGLNNGWEINPIVEGGHGFQAEGSGGGFDATLVPDLPYTTNGNISIVKAIRADPFDIGRPCIQVAAVLTVVEEIPPGNGALVFRPPYIGSEKPYYYVSDLRTELLPQFDSIGIPPSIDYIIEKFKRVRLDHKKGAMGRGVRPREAMADYQPKNTADIINAALYFMLNKPIEDKMPALIQYIQAGIDKIHTIYLGQTWPAGGGHQPGHVIMTSFTATLLNIEAAKTLLNNATFFHASNYLAYPNYLGQTLWGEDRGSFSFTESTYWTYVESFDGSRSIRDPYGFIDGGTIGAYQHITSQSHKGEWLASYLMPVLKQAWPQSELALLENYAKRWVNYGTLTQPDPCAPFDGNTANRGITYGPDPQNPGMCILDQLLEYYNGPTDFAYPPGIKGGRFSNDTIPGNDFVSGSGYDGAYTDGGQYRSSFVAALWDAYLVPDNVTLVDHVFDASTDSCFGALQNITVAGDGNTVEFQSGSSVNLIAGNSIQLLPGTHIQQGAYVHASITTDGSFCDQIQQAIVSAEPIAQKSESYHKPVIAKEFMQQILKVFPNPNNGNFTIQIEGFSQATPIVIYNSLGENIHHEMINTEKTIDISNVQSGLYFIKTFSNNKQIIQKILIR